MSRSDVTRWFPGTVNPPRPGVYQRKYRGHSTSRPNLGYALWNGKFWKFRRDTAQGAASEQVSSTQPDLQWRGLTYHEYKRRGGK